MNYSKDIIRFVDKLVANEAEYDVGSKQYDLRFQDICSDELGELCALIMEKDKDYAAECTGPDNPAFLKTMLPALLESLKLNDLDNRFWMTDKWRDGIIAYQEKSLRALIEERLEHFNQTSGTVSREFTTRYPATL